ncbi:MAG: hypothetical protein IJ491_02745 [Clostridia bacterium]|nr:hypothetical protein [Clostridia bacterium]
MKKKYIALIISVVFLVGILSGAYMFFKDGKAFHTGHALISRTGEFIFVNENGSPIVMGDAENKIFRGITDGDKVLVAYGTVLTSYPARGGTSFCIKLSDGTIEDVNKDAVKQLGELGWLKGEAPFEGIEADKIRSITIAEYSSRPEVIKQKSLTKKQIEEFVPMLEKLEFAHDEGKMYYGGCIRIEIEFADGETEIFAIFTGANSVQFNDTVYTATPSIGSIQDYAINLLDLNY